MSFIGLTNGSAPLPPQGSPLENEEAIAFQQAIPTKKPEEKGDRFWKPYGMACWKALAASRLRQITPLSSFVMRKKCLKRSMHHTQKSL